MKDIQILKIVSKEKPDQLIGSDGFLQELDL